MAEPVKDQYAAGEAAAAHTIAERDAERQRAEAELDWLAPAAPPEASDLLGPAWVRMLSEGEFGALAGVVAQAERIEDAVSRGLAPSKVMLEQLASAVAALRASRKEESGE